MEQKQLILRGTMRGHTDWVTAIATAINNSDTVVSSSRDKSIIDWALTKEEKTYGVVRRRLIGHDHYVQDVVLSSDGNYPISASWDCWLLMWDLKTGQGGRDFIEEGHTKEVLSVDLSPTNRRILSGSRDKTIKIWNTLGQCAHTFQDAHSDYVSCVRFLPNDHRFVSCSWDGTVKIWTFCTFELLSTLSGHSGPVNTVAVSPDGSLCASGGNDGMIFIWNLQGNASYNRSLVADSIVNALCFSPNRLWLCAATEAGITIWDLESDSVVVDLKRDIWEATAEGKNEVIYCTCLNWSADGNTLFTGHTDGVIRVWGVEG